MCNGEDESIKYRGHNYFIIDKIMLILTIETLFDNINNIYRTINE